MKNLSKRNKTLLSIGVVIVVVVAGLLLLKPPPIDQLLGASAVSITPENPTITQGQTIQLSAKPAALCTWSGEAGVSVVSAGASTTVQGVSVGTFKVTAKCPLGTAFTNVTVRGTVIQPSGGVLATSTSYQFYTSPGESCTWSTTCGGISLPNPAASIRLMTSTSKASCGIQISCPSGSSDLVRVTLCPTGSTDPECSGGRPSGE